MSNKLVQCSVVKAGDGFKHEIVAWLEPKWAIEGKIVRRTGCSDKWLVWRVYGAYRTDFLKINDCFLLYGKS
jgi:hypothetical protein